MTHPMNVSTTDDKIIEKPTGGFGESDGSSDGTGEDKVWEVWFLTDGSAETDHVDVNPFVVGV
ncbi:hypothetical protein BGZ95_007120, partial [Linnemannia exigua]